MDRAGAARVRRAMNVDKWRWSIQEGELFYGEGWLAWGEAPELPVLEQLVEALNKRHMKFETLFSYFIKWQAAQCTVRAPREFLAMLATAPDEVWIEFALLT